MKAVFQTVIDRTHGNCLSAALASLLEIEIEDVPNFEVCDGDFQARVNEWLRAFGYAWFRTIEPRMTRGKGFVDMGRLPETGDEMVRHSLPDGLLCLATGKSPRGEYYHSVVGQISGGLNFEMLHDPHPSGDGLEGLPVCLEFLVPLNPASKKEQV
jgi:hypothetical protein